MKGDDKVKFVIDYEYGRCNLYTPDENWENRFYELANQCFGIRKSIGEVRLISKENVNPPYLIIGEYERLEYHGDLIVWDENGKKIKSEWD